MKIAVIGAGPAGSSSAYFLRQDGHEVFLIDPIAPHEKTCGGGVPVKCIRKFPEFYADFEGSKDLYESMIFSFEGNDFCRVPMPGGMGIFSREKHDAHIFKKALDAGVIFFKEKFKDCQKNDSGWQVITDHQSLQVDFIVGADGATSRVRNRLAGKLPRESYFKAADYLINRTDLPLHIGFQKNLNGYLWVFPRKGNTSVGIVDFEDNSPLRHQILSDYFQKFNLTESDIIKKRSALIPSLRKKDVKEVQVCGDGWALVGDAAGLAEPVTGEGIYYALCTAKLMSQCLKSGKDYNVLWKKEFRQIVTESEVSRMAFRAINMGVVKFLLSRSNIMRSLTGDYLAAFSNGSHSRLKFISCLPFAFIQALFSRRVTCE